MRIREVIAEARRRDDPNHLIDAVPYAGTLGLRGAATPEGLVTRLPFRQDLVGNPHLPALHGGVVAAFLELTAAFSLLWRLDGDAIPRSVTLSVDYLRSAGPRESFGRGEITRLGRRVANVRVLAWQDDPARPFAQGNVHLLITPHLEAAGTSGR